MALGIKRAVGGPTPAPTILSDRERWIWISPRGVVRELTGFVDDTEVLRGMAGRNAPPVVVQRDVVPGLAGARVREIRHDIREVDVPLIAASNSFDDLQALVSQISRDMNAVDGEGILRRVDKQGNEFDLFCHCVAGLGLNDEGSMGPAAARMALVFVASDPYWYAQRRVLSFGNSSAVDWFPMLPLKVGSAGVLGNVQVPNAGDVVSWPIWTINGPGNNIVLTNNTTGQVVELDHALTSGQQAIIDTRPGYKSVTGPAGVNWRRYLVHRSLWGLVAGANEVNLTMGSATSASYVSLSYRPALLAPTMPITAAPPLELTT